MIKTILALTTGGVIGLGFLTQEPDATQEREVKRVRVTRDAQDRDAQDRDAQAIELAEVAKSKVVVELSEHLADLLIQDAELAQKLGPNHPKLVMLHGQIESLQEVLKKLQEFEKADSGTASADSLFGTAEVEVNGELLETSETADGIVTLRVDGNQGMGWTTSRSGDSFTIAGLNPKTNFPGGTPFFGVARAGVHSVNQYAARWKEASEEERKEILKKVRTEATERFDSEMEHREKELEEIKDRYDRLKDLLERRAAKRDDILDRYVEDLQLNWEGLGFPSQPATAPFNLQGPMATRQGTFFLNSAKGGITTSGELAVPSPPTPAQPAQPGLPAKTVRGSARGSR